MRVRASILIAILSMAFVLSITISAGAWPYPWNPSGQSHVTSPPMDWGRVRDGCRLIRSQRWDANRGQFVTIWREECRR